MSEIKDLKLDCVDAELLLQEITPIQAETLLGGYCQYDENYPYVYIINITKNPSPPKKSEPKMSEPEIKPQGTGTSSVEVNSVDNSRKIYINGVPVKEQRNIIILY
jgi:hypothetical protein